MNLKNVIEKKNEAAQFMIDEITHICTNDIALITYCFFKICDTHTLKKSLISLLTSILSMISYKNAIFAEKKVIRFLLHCTKHLQVACQEV